MTKMQANLGLNTDNWLPLLDQVSERDYMEGFIMDGDQAKPTSTLGARFPRSHISVCFISLIYLQTGVEKHGQGTKQFMSAHLLQQWGNDETSMKAIHTQLDDLESFLWVIIFIGLHSFHRVQRSLTAQEEKYLKNIEGSVDALANFKRLMLADIRKSDPAFMLDCPNIVCLTRYFPLREWAYLAETWCSEMRLLESFTTAEPESEDAKKLDDKLREIFLESKHHYAAWLLPGWLKREELSATITWRNA
jgi:hypothetical protein